MPNPTELSKVAVVSMSGVLVLYGVVQPEAKMVNENIMILDIVDTFILVFLSPCERLIGHTWFISVGNLCRVVVSSRNPSLSPPTSAFGMTAMLGVRFVLPAPGKT